MMRAMLLRASENRWLAERAPKYEFVRRAVARFMPGESLDDATRAAKALSEFGAAAILTQLGENVTTPEEAERVVEHYLDQIDRIEAADLDAEPSVKLTQLGLDLGNAICERNLDRLLARAAASQRRIWIDMEGSKYTDRTLDLFKAARRQHPLTGVCLQAYLYRTDADVSSLLADGPTVRLVKGAYKEPADRAYPQKSDVDRSFIQLADRFFEAPARRAGARLAVATHDEVLIRRIRERLTAQGLPKDAVEFQFLYGIKTNLQRALAADGFSVRVLISYGASWFPWYVRRLAERPANLMFVLRNLVHG
jgi:proline dehydrogenase